MMQTMMAQMMQHHAVSADEPGDAAAGGDPEDHEQHQQH
jgi:hypothetical protein